MLGDLIPELDLLETLAVKLDSTHHHSEKTWKHLAPALGMPPSDIESLERPSVTLVRHLIESHPKLTVMQFRDVLQEMGRHDVVAILDQYIHNPKGNCSH